MEKTFEAIILSMLPDSSVTLWLLHSLTYDICGREGIWLSTKCPEEILWENDLCMCIIVNVLKHGYVYPCDCIQLLCLHYYIPCWAWPWQLRDCIIDHMKAGIPYVVTPQPEQTWAPRGKSRARATTYSGIMLCCWWQLTFYSACQCRHACVLALFSWKILTSNWPGNLIPVKETLTQGETILTYLGHCQPVLKSDSDRHHWAWGKSSSTNSLFLGIDYCDRRRTPLTVMTLLPSP